MIIAAMTGLFAPVLIVVVVAGVAGGLVAILRRGDPFDRERGELWMEHGASDSSPHRMEGARPEDRHVIDPEPDSGGVAHAR